MQQELDQLRKIIEENNINNNKQNIEYENQINNLQNLLKGKDALLKQYEGKKDNNDDINNLINEMNNKDNYINELKNIISDNDINNQKIIENYNLEKNELLNQIYLLNEQLKNNNTNYNITDINKKNSELNNIIKKLQKQLNEYNNKLKEKEKEVLLYKTKLQEQLKQSQISKEALYNSGNTLEMAMKGEEESKNKSQQIEMLLKENGNLKNNNNQLNQRIDELTKQNENYTKVNKDLMSQYAIINQKNSELLQQVNNLSLNQNVSNNNNINNNDLSEIKKKQEENEGLQIFIQKLTKDCEKYKEELENNKQRINMLQKENTSMKNQLERLAVEMPKELNALQRQLANRKNQGNDINNDNNINILLNKKNKEISDLKDKNKELQYKLEEKEAKDECSRYKTEDANLSNYEEEFDLRKMASGARAKNRSEDINIDYPGIQGVKERLKEVQFRLKNLEEQVKILISKVKCNDKIKPAFVQICQLLGYDPPTIDKICTSEKEKKKILGV